jgi:hypothetical protein
MTLVEKSGKSPTNADQREEGSGETKVASPRAIRGLLSARRVLDKPIPPPIAMCRTRHEMLPAAHRLSMRALAIMR